eukprot:6788182-Prymnesium_polylepis.1
MQTIQSLPVQRAAVRRSLMQSLSRPSTVGEDSNQPEHSYCARKSSLHSTRAGGAAPSSHAARSSTRTSYRPR